MGLDINLRVENQESLFGGDEQFDYFYVHGLSRTFCNLMCRRDVIASGEPELDQVGAITGVDISPLYAMNDYPDEEALAFYVDMADTEAEKQQVLTDATNSKASLQGNIPLVTDTLNLLIEKLSLVANLPGLLAPTDFDSLDNGEYFGNFNSNPGDGYIGNNFGQDLRNFKRFLQYAQSKGATTVFFVYG